MRRVLIESPYAGNTERNVEYAKEAILDCLRRGEAPIASHLLLTQPGLLEEGVPGERNLGIEVGLAWIKGAELMALYVDYGISRGMMEARERAIRLKLPWEERRLR